MSACLAPISPVDASSGNTALPATNYLPLAVRDYDRQGRARQIKHVLKRAGLTVCRASTLTGMRYGKDTPYHVPSTFLYKIRNGITPHVCQLVALSQVTGCRFSDWMNLCGFDLRLILPLQLEVHSERTALITPAHPVSPHDFPFAYEKSRAETPDRYLFAKVGSRDNVVYPKLLSGSVVRVDRCYLPQIRAPKHAEELLWLVEHPGGLSCCHVKRINDEHVVLLPNRPPLSGWPLLLSREARVLGLIDLEFRLRKPQQFKSEYRAVRTDTLATIPCANHAVTLSTLLRRSRARTGLTLRAAHEKTVRVAELLQNPEYRIPLGLLSDYEAIDRFPRHIAKIISLCVVYGIDFWQLLQAGGSQIDDSGKVPIFSPDFNVPHVCGFGTYGENVKHG